MFGTVNIFFTGFIQAPGKRRKKQRLRFRQTESLLVSNESSIRQIRSLCPKAEKRLFNGTHSGTLSNSR